MPKDKQQEQPITQKPNVMVVQDGSSDLDILLKKVEEKSKYTALERFYPDFNKTELLEKITDLTQEEIDNIIILRLFRKALRTDFDKMDLTIFEIFESSILSLNISRKRESREEGVKVLTSSEDVTTIGKLKTAMLGGTK